MKPWFHAFANPGGQPNPDPHQLPKTHRPAFTCLPACPRPTLACPAPPPNKMTQPHLTPIHPTLHCTMNPVLPHPSLRYPVPLDPTNPSLPMQPLSITQPDPAPACPALPARTHASSQVGTLYQSCVMTSRRQTQTHSSSADAPSRDAAAAGHSPSLISFSFFFLQPESSALGLSHTPDRKEVLSSTRVTLPDAAWQGSSHQVTKSQRPTDPMQAR